MTFGRSALQRVALLGGVGGAVNAALCYLQWPAPAADGMDFSPWIVPAGFAHGALLALCAVYGLAGLRRLRLTSRIAAAPLVGWIVGWLTFIPLHLAIQAIPFSPTHFLDGGSPVELSDWFTFKDLQRTLWPFEWSVETLWIPFLNFGAVAVTYWLLRLLLGRIGERAPVIVASWIVAGMLGSLWWWASYGPWWFSILHGAIWGGLIGVAHIVPHAQQKA